MSVSKRVRSLVQLLSPPPRKNPLFDEDITKLKKPKLSFAEHLHKIESNLIKSVASDGTVEYKSFSHDDSERVMKYLGRLRRSFNPSHEKGSVQLDHYRRVLEHYKIYAGKHYVTKSQHLAEFARFSDN